MPAKWFICPDGEQIEIERCLQPKGCRLKKRCASLPFLRLIGFDREFKGITPSAAGNGPRCIYLKAIHDYAIDPNNRVWAAFGTSTHEKLSLHSFTFDVLSEEKLSDDKIEGIADLLEPDEWNKGYYVLTDYKNWGSYKVAKALGIISKVHYEPVLENGEKVYFKSGKRKGQEKTKKVTNLIVNPKKADLRAEELQLNRYRILFEKYGFPISEIRIQAMVRDGGLYSSKARGVERNLEMINVNILPDEAILAFYAGLKAEVEEAFEYGYTRRCDSWESWEGRKCAGYCEVAEFCKEMGE